MATTRDGSTSRDCRWTTLVFSVARETPPRPALTTPALEEHGTFTKHRSSRHSSSRSSNKSNNNKSNGSRCRRRCRAVEHRTVQAIAMVLAVAVAFKAAWLMRLQRRRRHGLRFRSRAPRGGVASPTAQTTSIKGKTRRGQLLLRRGSLVHACRMLDDV